MIDPLASAPSLWPIPASLSEGRYFRKAMMEAWIKVRDRLESAMERGSEIAFCTNTMLNRGNVFVCTINDKGEAVIAKHYDWWSCKFSEPCTTRAGEILGKVSIERRSGCETFKLCCGWMSEGRG